MFCIRIVSSSDLVFSDSATGISCAESAVHDFLDVSPELDVVKLRATAISLICGCLTDSDPKHEVFLSVGSGC